MKELETTISFESPSIEISTKATFIESDMTVIKKELKINTTHDLLKKLEESEVRTKEIIRCQKEALLREKQFREESKAHIKEILRFQEEAVVREKQFQEKDVVREKQLRGAELCKQKLKEENERLKIEILNSNYQSDISNGFYKWVFEENNINYFMCNYCKIGRIKRTIDCKFHITIVHDKNCKTYSKKWREENIQEAQIKEVNKSKE